MTKDQFKPVDPLKPLSVPELMKARSQNPVQFYVIDDFGVQSAEYAEKMRLGERIQGVIEAYESATTPKQRYKAGSELCRLVDRISGGTAVVQSPGIQNGNKRYFAHVRRDGEYRIPELHVLDNIKPTELSRIEFDIMFPDKSGSMPRERTPEEREAMKESVDQFYQGVFGIDKDSFRRYVDIVSQFGDGRARGIRKE